MYKIYADDILIYDSTIEDYKLNKATITLETNKSGSFTFSIYPEHFYYDRFIRLKTVITVYKSTRIIFRGRILNDASDYWNIKTITCEGELGFLQDSQIRPYTFNGTPEELFRKFITDHNSQVDEFKRFKIGSVTVEDLNGYIARSNSNYETALSNMTSRLIEDSLGGYFFITHDDGTDPIPTIHYLADFTKVAAQTIEFGSNLTDYTKTVKADDIATAIIPLGATVNDGDENTEDLKLTIASVNGGKDYIYDEAAVALYGWIFKTVDYTDVTEPSILKSKGEAYLQSIVKQNITIELKAIDLHLIDRSIESFKICDYVRVISAPHNFDSTLLCNKQTIDLLNPQNDALVLGYSYSTFTERNTKMSTVVSSMSSVKNEVTKFTQSVIKLDTKVADTTVYYETSLANKVLYNNLGNCVIVGFDLEGVAFSTGLATIDISTFIPVGYSLISCIAQLAESDTIVIPSVSIAESVITIRGRNITDGSAYSGSVTGVIRCLAVCQKIEEETVDDES